MKKSEFTEHVLLQVLLEQSDLNVFWKDCDRRFLGASRSFLEYYDLTEKDILGKTDEEMGWHINPEPYQNDEYQVIQSGTPIYESEGKCIIRGQVRHIVATKFPVRNEDEEIIGLCGYFRDVTDQKEDKDRLITKAHTDDLTGLANRRGLMEAMNEYVAEYEKRGVDFAVIFIDVNGFKEMNQAYGHEFGDKYLMMIAKDLLKITGNSGVVARLGGDCFVILRQIPREDTPSMVSETILSLLDHIRLKQREIRMLNEHSFRVDAAVGWAAYSEFESVDETMRKADERMYAEKEN